MLHTATCLSFSVYPSIYLSVCLSACLSVYLSIYISICVSACLPTYLLPSVCLPAYLSVFISVHLSINPYFYLIYISVYLSVPASVRPLSVFPSVHLYVRLSSISMSVLSPSVCSSVRLFVHPPVRPSVCLSSFCHYVTAICLEFFFIISFKFEGSVVCNATCFSVFPITPRL